MSSPDYFDEFEDSILTDQENHGSGSESVCLVCGRTSNTGHHYGVQSCLGCKTFFRRIVLKGIQPKCKFNGRCKLEKGVHAKRLCRSCRLQRCRDIGMTETALHPCRDVIGRRRRSPSTGSPSTSTNSESIDTPIDSIRAISAMEFVKSVRDRDVVLRAQLANAHAQEAPHDPEHFYTTPSVEVLLSRLHLNVAVGSALRNDLQLIREWVDSLGPLCALSDDAKRGLISQFCLKFTILEHGLLTQRIPMVGNVWFYGDLSCYITDFSNIPVHLRSQITPSIEADHALLQPLFRSLREEVVSALDRLQPTTFEVAAVKLIMLLTRDGTPLETAEKELLDAVRDEVLLGLHQWLIASRHPNVAQRLGELLMLCGTLSMASQRGREQLRMLQFFDKANFDAASWAQLFPTEA